MKTTLLIDCQCGAVLNLHCTTSRKHDTKIGWQALTRYLDRLNTITADNGYDWDNFRPELRENHVRPVIKHREFNNLDKAHNAGLTDDVYHQRSVLECSFRVIKKR